MSPHARAGARRRALLVFVPVLLLVLAALFLLRPRRSAPVPSPQPSRAPVRFSGWPANLNVVLLVADGLDTRLGCYGGGLPSPNIDALAAAGRTFLAAYAQSPDRDASRRSLLSGRAPEDPDKPSPSWMPAVFRKHGYLTARIGRFPRAEGKHDAWERRESAPHGPPSALAAAVTRLLASRGKRPLFLAVSLDAPPESAMPARALRPPISHGTAPPVPAIVDGDLPYLARPGRTTRPAPIPIDELDRLERAAEARTAAADAAVGAIRKALRESGDAGRTAVVLLSDHAVYLGGRGALHRRDTLFDDSLHVPLVVSVPGLPRGGEPTGRIAELLDLYPTLLDISGIPRPDGLSGRSLASSLVDPDRPGPGAAFAAVQRSAGGVGRSVRTARYRFNEWPDGSRELYDHEADPNEFHNLARDPDESAAVERMRELLEARYPSEPPAPTAGPPPGGRPPNVLMVILDDLNVHVGSYGYDVQTPNMDRLAREGRRFALAYAQVAMCAPSRTSLLSGWQPERVNVWHNFMPPNIPEATPLEEYFHAHGYFTAYVGKVYEQAYRKRFHWDLVPADLPPGPADEGNEESEAAHAKRGFWLITDRPEAEETDGRTARAAAAILEAHHDRPFFLAVGFVRPHLRWKAPRKYFDLYPPDRIRFVEAPADDLDDVPAIAIKSRPQDFPGVSLSGREPPGLNDDPEFRRYAIAAYHACVSFADAQLGIVLGTLDRLGLTRNTIVVLFGDHGFHLGEHRGLWRKDTLFEEAVHTPLLLMGPGVSRPGVATSAPVELLDVYPTLVELAGLPPVPGVDGRSLVPFLRDPAATWARPAYSFRRAKPPLLGRTVRTAQHRFTLWPDGSEELYDLRGDPGERRNLAGDPAEAATLARMRTLLVSGRQAPAGEGEP